MVKFIGVQLPNSLIPLLIWISFWIENILISVFWKLAFNQMLIAFLSSSQKKKHVRPFSKKKILNRQNQANVFQWLQNEAHRLHLIH